MGKQIDQLNKATTISDATTFPAANGGTEAQGVELSLLKNAILGDTSGALVELSNIVTAGKKQIAANLTAKGITNIAATDTLSKMADGINALDTNGIGGVNPNVPLVVYSSNMSPTPLTPDNYFIELPNGYTANIYLYNATNTTVNFMNMANAVLPAKGNNYTQPSVQFRIDLAAVSSACGITLSNPANIINIKGTNDFVCYANGYIVKIVIDYENGIISSATAVQMTADSSSTVQTVTGSQWTVIATNADTDTALISTVNNRLGLIGYVNMSTGVFHTDNNSTSFWQPISNYTSYIQVTQDILLGYANSSFMCILKINWNDIDNSNCTTLTTAGNPSIRYDEEENKIYLLRLSDNGILRLFVYDIATNVLTTTTFTSNFTNASNQILVGTPLGSTRYSYNGLTIIKHTNGYRTYCSGQIAITVDTNNQIIPYVLNSDIISTGMKYNAQYTQNIGGESYYTKKINGEYYCINIVSRTSAYWQIYKMDLYYNKVVNYLITKNNQTVRYMPVIPLSAENLADGGPLDATTVTLDVDVSSAADSASSASGESGNGSGSENTSGQEG